MSANDSHLSSTYVSTIDAGIDQAYEALLEVDPIASLATRLGALGVADRAIWAESTGATDATDARQIGISLIWRFGPADQTAMIRWNVGLSEDGTGRAVISVAVHVTPSNDEAARRLVAAWSILETIALQHAGSLRNAVVEHVDDLAESDHVPIQVDPSRHLALHA